MSEYKGIIDKLIVNNYEEILIINGFQDKIYRYQVRDNDFVCNKELSYMDYLRDCKNFIYQDDVDDYVDSLSLSKLEAINNSVMINYRMKDGLGTYREYNNMIKLYDDNGEKIIVVFVSLSTGNSVNYESNDSCKNSLETKLNKIVDSVGLAILKIHNIMNNDSSYVTKKEYVDSILASLTSEFPEFNEVLNSNAMNLYNREKSTIMIVDDDKMTCSLIKKIFDKDYEVVIKNNGEEAIEYLSNSGSVNISCIFLDLLMPVLDGFSVLDYLNSHNYLNMLPVIIISGNYDKDTRRRAYGYQIADMLEKPFNVQVVRHRIENLINLYRSSNSLNDMMLEQHRELKNVVNSLIVAYEMDNGRCMDLVKRLTRALTMQVSVMYPEYNINSNMIDKIANSACYFAIGNYTLPKSLLYKRGIYTEEERSIKKMGTLNGASIIKYVLSKENKEIDGKYCYEICKYCNERYDGNGYPEGLSGNSIPLSAQIASVAIEYCNLINSINPIDYDKVASLIIMESGRKFSPKIIESFKRVQEEYMEITKVGE